MIEFSLESTAEEILGPLLGNSPTSELCQSIQKIFKVLFPSKWLVERSWASNQEVSIIYENEGIQRGTSLVLDNEIEHNILLIGLRFTHHEEWHKPISLGSITIAPQDRIVPLEKIGKNHGDWKSYPVWYPTLDDQIALFEDPRKRAELYDKFNLTEAIKKIQDKLKG